MSNLSLTRTIAALAEYDAHYATGNCHPGMSNADCLVWEAKEQSLGMAVGVAFGHDTADRNSMDTCRACVRPGPPVAGPGSELSFVRRMVAKSQGKD